MDAREGRAGAGRPPDSDAAAAQAATDAIRKHILVRAQVELVDYGSLPRTDRKSRRVFDRRLEENGHARS